MRLRRKPRYGDLRLSRLDNGWLWVVYFDNYRVCRGGPFDSVREAMSDATEHCKPDKIITARIEND